MKKNFLAAFIISLAFCAQTYAQNIRGTVLDENESPMEFATVALLALPDSTIVGGGMADIDGVFDIERPENASLVQISMIGYKKVEMPVAQFASPVTVRLQPDTQMLEGAVVTVQLPRTEIKGDAVVTNVAGSVLEHTGNALDVLAKVPGMINNGGKLEVIGRGEPVYYLNGRKVTDNSELRNLMSEDIKSIDVVSNPGALYAGDVRCVVRIRTVKHQGDGLSFALTSQAKQHIYDCKDFEPSWSVLDLNYRTGGWDFFGKLVYWNQRSYQFSELEDDSYVNGISHYQAGIIDVVNHNSGLQYVAGANWQINEGHSLGFKIECDENTLGKSVAMFDTDVRINGEAIDHLKSTSTAVNPYNGQWRGNLYYDGNVGKLNINFNADFIDGRVHSDTETKETGWHDPVEITASTTSGTSLGAGKLVLSYPVWKGMLQAGTEETYVLASQDYKITMNEIPSANAALSENTIAGFAQYSLPLPFGMISAGLRFEHVDMTYNDFLVPSNRLERHQNNWFPSFSFSAAAGQTNFSLSYTGKTVRPGYHMLSNEIMYDNHFIYQSGDPTLLNEKRRTLSFNANWQWITLSSNYERVDNLFVQWASPFNNEGVVILKYANLNAPIRRLSLYLTAAPSFGVWYPQVTTGMKRQFVNLTVEDSSVAGGTRVVSLDKPMFFVQANNAFRFKNSWTAEANYQYISTMNQDIYLLTKPLQGLEFSVQKSFLKNDALTFRLSWSDVLNRSVTYFHTDYGSYIVDQSNNGYQPCIQLRVSYRFNSATDKYKGTGAGQSAKNRL